ncbi:protein SON-like isoform X2 [Patiria miniata]|uniref:Protein SON n=1 Tax=Patiria miniata TaxID=46514 RepID=A0A913ZB29_PATMI|nr:protein SON-like isoform X2 [Patiria miniata]XP_038048095.1 protein SON-like isoform X2 [Patiria miniata]
MHCLGKIKMAGLDEVLRSFALQKMQELKEKQRDEDTEDTKPALDECNERQQSSDATSNSNGKDEHNSANKEVKAEMGNDAIQKTTKTSPEQLKSEIDENMKEESKPMQMETSSSKDGKDKKITIKLLTKKIEPEATMHRDAEEEVAEEEMDDVDSSTDSSDDENEGEVKDGKPWRKVYEEGELSPSSESEEEADGVAEGEAEGEGEGEEEANEEANVTKEDGMDSDTSGEIKDEDAKKSKKHKKHKHKKHKHSKGETKEESPKEKHKHKDKSKKDKKKDKQKKEHKSKEKDPDKDKSKDKKKSKDKASKGDEVDKLKKENDSGKDKHKEKSEKKEAKEKKHKSRHKEKGGDSKEEKTKSSSKRKHRSGSRSRSQSPSKSKSTSHHKKRKRSKSRSRSPKTHKHSQSTRLRSREEAYYRSTSPDRYYSRRYGAGSGSRYVQRSRSRSPRSDDEFKIDKAKLLEIAKANAYAKMQSGEFPPYMKLTPKSVVTKVDPKERRSVEELTAVCKEIASKQQDDSDSDDSPINKPVGSDDETDEPFIRHPFKVREAPLGNVGIVMNIRNAVQKPIQDKEMLRLTFPVSSGSQHRKKEDELGPKPYGDWVSIEKKPKMMDPVAKPTTKIMPTPGTETLTPAEATPGVPGVTTAVTAPTVTDPAAAAVAAAAAAAAMPPPPVPPPPTTVAPAPAPEIPTPTPPMPPPTPPAPLTFAGIISPAGALPTSSAIAAASAIPAAVAAAEYASVAAAAAVSKAMAVTVPPAPIGVAAMPPVAQKDQAKEDKVFEEIPNQKVDIAAMVSARLKAARRLEHNPNDVEALSVMHKAQTQIRNWTMGKQKPGMFTGDTGLRTLRPQELANTDPRAQAWAKKAKHHPELCSSHWMILQSPHATRTRLE